MDWWGPFFRGMPSFKWSPLANPWDTLYHLIVTESSRTDSPDMSTKDSTTTTATAANIPQPKTNFFSLPGEIRNIIYKMVLTTPYTYDPVRRRFGKLETNLLHVSRKVRTESSDILHGANIWVYARICASEADHTSFNNAVPRQPGIPPGLFRRMGPRTLSIKLEVRNEANSGETSLKRGYLLAIQSMRLFVRWLWTVTSKDRIAAWKARTTTGSRIELPIRSSHLSLDLHKSLFHSRTKLQETCLEPFALVGTLASIKIRGDIDPAVRQKLLKRMKSLFISAKSAIGIGNDLLRRGDIARRCGDHLEACNIFDHGHIFVYDAAEYLWATSKIGAATEEMRILSALRNVLRSRLARSLLYIGQFKPAKQIATDMIARFKLTDVDRLSLTVCKGCARLGLWDDECEENPIANSDEYEEFVSVLGQAPRACIRTYFETFPSTDKGLEAKWMEVAVRIGAAAEGDFGAGVWEIHAAITRAQNELLKFSTRYRATLAGPPSFIVSAMKEQLLLKR